MNCTGQYDWNSALCFFFCSITYEWKITHGLIYIYDQTLFFGLIRLNHCNIKLIPLFLFWQKQPKSRATTRTRNKAASAVHFGCVTKAVSIIIAPCKSSVSTVPLAPLRFGTFVFLLAVSRIGNLCTRAIFRHFTAFDAIYKIYLILIFRTNNNNKTIKKKKCEVKWNTVQARGNK